MSNVEVTPEMIPDKDEIGLAEPNWDLSDLMFGIMELRMCPTPRLATARGSLLRRSAADSRRLVTSSAVKTPFFLSM